MKPRPTYSSSDRDDSCSQDVGLGARCQTLATANRAATCAL
jgi:hypothetical protein